MSHRDGRGAETIGEVSLLCGRARDRLRDRLEAAFVPVTAESGREGCLPFAIDLALLKTLLASLHRVDAALSQIGGALDEAERGPFSGWRVMFSVTSVPRTWRLSPRGRWPAMSARSAPSEVTM